MERKRRSFTPEYKAEVVGLIRDGGKAASSVARDLGLTESAVRRWVLQSETDAGCGAGKILTTAERKELSQLRREIRQLRMEREILKKRRPFSPRNRREASIHSGGEGRVSGNADEPDIASWQCSYKRTVFVCRRDAPLGEEFDTTLAHQGCRGASTGSSMSEIYLRSSVQIAV